MKRLTGIAVALALLGQQGIAVAQSPDAASANFVMQGCREFVNETYGAEFRKGVCAGVVRAMFFFGRTKLGICPPNGANTGQAIRVVASYIDQRPERMHERFEDLAVEALQQAWPYRR